MTVQRYAEGTKRDSLVCVKCGGGAVTVSKTRPSVDDRFALGFCDRCASPPKSTHNDPARKKALPRVVPLIRQSLYDPRALDEVRRADADRALVERVFDRPKGERPPSDADCEAAEAVLARWDAAARARQA